MNAKDPGKWSLSGAINILEDNEQCHRTTHSAPSGRYEVWRGGNKLPSRRFEPVSLQWCSLSPFSQRHRSFLHVSIFLFLSCPLSLSSQYVVHAGPETLLLPRLSAEILGTGHHCLAGLCCLFFFVNDHPKAPNSLTLCLELTYLATLAAKGAENVVFVLDGPVSINQAKRVGGYWEVSDIFYPSVNARKFTLENYNIRLKLSFLK